MMDYLDYTYSAPCHNLACDEALLLMCESGYSRQILRFWESSQYFVVLGHSNPVSTEVNLPNCRLYNIPVFRRTSGGGAVLQGPGCLNYSLILRIEKDGPLDSIRNSNKYVLHRHQQALQSLLNEPLKVCGISDLALGELKVSGNAQRRKKHYILIHGTFLLEFDLDLVEKVLPFPAHQPEYRKNRPHRHFITNLPLSPEVVKEALKVVWGASEMLENIPNDSIEELVASKYTKDEWNYKF